MPDITLSPQNTVNLTAGTVTRLFIPGGTGLVQAANLMNLGPGTVWVRTGTDPAVNDPKSEKLLANSADNGVQFARFIGLIAEADTTIVLRLVAT